MNKLYNIHSVWIILILLTLFTYALSFLNANNTSIMLVLIITSLIKGIMIIREFMELKGVSLIWKLIMYGWLIFVCLSIFIAYLISAY